MRRQAERGPQGDREERRVGVPVAERELERSLVEVATYMVPGEQADNRDDSRKRAGDGEWDQRQMQAAAQQGGEPDSEPESERVSEDPLAIPDRDVGGRAPER
jgi:hypothetical protein